MDKINQLKQAFHALCEAVPDPVMVISQEGQYVSTHGGQVRELYHDPKCLIGKYFCDIFKEDKACWFLGIVREALKTGELVLTDYQLSSQDLKDFGGEGPTEPQWFEGRVFAMKEGFSETPCVVWIAINITKRKELENHLRFLSSKDSLTGVLNRRAFLKILENNFEVAKRYNHSLSILMIDFDHFKKINDTFGHDAGDAVLTHFASQCLALLRKADVIARYGGEEFIILLPNTSFQNGISLAERIRKTIADFNYIYNDQQIPYTVSIGISEQFPDDLDCNELIRNADKALYQAKRDGRNRVNTYSK